MYLGARLAVTGGKYVVLAYFCLWPVFFSLFFCFFFFSFGASNYSYIYIYIYICRQLVDMSLLRISLHRLVKKSRKRSRLCKVVALTPLT